MATAALPPFQHVLDEHAEPVLRYLIASLGRQEADDAFQETFMSAMRAYPRLRANSNVRAWLMTIAHRKALDVHRARVRRPVPVEGVDERPGPARPEDDGDVWAAVGALPPRQREVLTLRYAADLSHREIAAALGCSEEAARRAAADGLAALRKEPIQR